MPIINVYGLGVDPPDDKLLENKKNSQTTDSKTKKPKSTTTTGSTANTTSTTTTPPVPVPTPLSAWQERLQAVKEGAEVKVNPKIVNVWNYKKNLSAMELSSYSPFVAVFVILDDDDQSLITSLKQKYSRQIKYWNADLGGATKKVLIPIGATQNVFDTVDMGGGVGINSFEIGYEGTLSQLKGSFNCTIPTLDDFNYDFSSTVLINPVNYFLIFHGWMGPGIVMDVPWNVKPGETWVKDTTELIEPGWWSMNSVVSWKRTFTLQGTGYSCEVQFGQIYRGGKNEVKEDAKNPYDNSIFYTSGQQNFMQGTSQEITETINSASELITKIDNANIYKGKNLEEIKEKINSTWFTDIKTWKENYSIKKTDENGVTKYIYSDVLYPLGMAIESVILACSDTSNTLAKVHYGTLDKSIPKYTFTLKSGEDKQDFDITVNSAFDIPISKKQFERILQKVSNKTIDHLRDICKLAPSIYDITFIGIEGTSANIDEAEYTHEISFRTMAIDKDANKEADVPIDGEDLIIDFRSQFSLVGEPQLQASGLGLEQIMAPAVWSKLFSSDEMKMNTDLKNKEVYATTTKTPGVVSDKNVSNVKLGDDDPFATEMLIKIANDDLPLRGFLIRSLAQCVQFDIHGTAGLQVMHICWLRGMSESMNGKHVILTLKDVVTPSGYYTTLKLGNLSVLRAENTNEKAEKEAAEKAQKEADDKKAKEEAEAKAKKEKDATDKSKEQTKKVEKQ